MIAALRAAMMVRYPRETFAIMEEVCEFLGGGGRRADALVLNLWRSQGLDLQGFEVKASRSDWLREKKDPSKAEALSKYCVGTDSRVLAADLRWVRAGDLVPGQELVGFDETSIGRGRARRWLPSTITGLSFERCPVWKIQMESGASMLCTEDHRWICASAPIGHWDPVFWATPAVIAARIKKSRCRMYMPRYFKHWEDASDYSAGFLAAAFDGEGSVSIPKNNWRISFAQKQNEMLASVEKRLLEYGFEFATYPHNANVNDDVFNLTVQGGFQEVARFLGQMRPPRLLSVFLRHFRAMPREMRAQSRDRIVSCERAGSSDVAVMSTSTGTFIADGYGSHNCNRWWLVATAPDIVKADELPPTWGLLELRKTRLYAVVKAPKLTPEERPWRFVCEMVRRAQDSVQGNQAEMQAAMYEQAKAQFVDEHKKSREDEIAGIKRQLEQAKSAIEAFQCATGLNVYGRWDHGRIAEAVELLKQPGRHEETLLERARTQLLETAKTLGLAAEQVNSLRPAAPPRAEGEAA